MEGLASELSRGAMTIRCKGYIPNSTIPLGHDRLPGTPGITLVQSTQTPTIIKLSFDRLKVVHSSYVLIFSTTSSRTPPK